MQEAVPRILRPTLADGVAGAALGALLGLLLGLSTSPVVAGVLAGLIALLGGIFGLSDKLIHGPSRAGLRRLTAFAIAATLVTPASIWMRTHEVLGVSLAEHRRTLDDIGITDRGQRIDLLRYLRYGLTPSNLKVAEKPGNSSGLYAYSLDDPFCQELRSVEARDGASEADFSKLLADHDARTREIGQRIAKLPEPADRQKAYRLSAVFLCGV